MEKKQKMELEAIEKDLSQLLEVTLRLENELDFIDNKYN